MDRLSRLRALCDADPNNAFAWYTLAMEQKKSDIKAALALFETVHQAHPTYLPSYYHFAKALEDAGETDRAREIYREGMHVAQSTGDMHTFGELEMALDLLS